MLYSIPMWAWIVLLISSEIAMIYGYIKCKTQCNTLFKTFFLFMIVFVPITVIGMIVNSCNELELIQGSAQNIVGIFPVIISFIFAIGIVVLGIVNLIKGNLAPAQRNILIFAIGLFFVGILMFVSIQILDSRGII